MDRVQDHGIRKKEKKESEGQRAITIYPLITRLLTFNQRPQDPEQRLFDFTFFDSDSGDGRFVTFLRDILFCFLLLFCCLVLDVPVGE